MPLPLRDQFAAEMVQRIAALDGWQAELASPAMRINVPRLAVVSVGADRKSGASTLAYNCELSLSVVCFLRAADAGTANALAWLSDRLADVERVVHSPLTWPHDAQVSVESVFMDPPDGATLVGEVAIVVRYQHNYDDPAQWTGAIVVS